jgi:hypothetical protein
MVPRWLLQLLHPPQKSERHFEMVEAMGLKIMALKLPSVAWHPLLKFIKLLISEVDNGDRHRPEDNIIILFFEKESRLINGYKAKLWVKNKDLNEIELLRNTITICPH